MNLKAVAIHIIAFVNFMAVFHELAHAITGLWFGWQLAGIYFTPFISWVAFKPISSVPPLSERLIVYGSGGIVEAVIFGAVIMFLKRNPLIMTMKEKYWVYLLCGWSFLYAVGEAVFLGVLAW